jgi:hypothetical protein
MSYAAPVPAGMCEHYVCRCAQAARLAFVYDVTGRGEDLVRAIGAHDQLVPCQLQDTQPPLGPKA